MQKKNFNFWDSKKFILSFLILSSFLYSSDSDCITVLNFLTSSQINITELLKTYLYKRVNSINQRNIVTTPTGLYYNNSDFFSNHLSLNVFCLTMPSGVYFTECSNKLSSLFNLSEIVNKFIVITDNILSGTKYASLNLPMLAKCVDYIAVNGIRTGGIAEGMFEINKSCFAYFQLPLLYQLYYISVPSEMQSTISMEITQLNFDPLAAETNKLYENSSRDVIIQHSVFDTFGFDRSILGFHYNFFEEVFGLDCRLFFPGKDIKEGIIGGNFSLACLTNKVKFSFKDLILGFIDPVLEKKNLVFENLLLDSIDKLVLATYYKPFKNSFYGISPALQMRIPIMSELFLNGYLSYVYNFSKQSIAYGYVPCDKTKFNLNYNTEDPQEACQILSFFGNEFVNRISLQPINSTLCEGDEFQGVFSIQSQTSSESILLGIDLWAKNESKNIPASNTIIYGNVPSACQFNLFTALELYKTFCNNPFNIQFFIQATTYSSGIGKEFGGKVQIEFFY